MSSMSTPESISADVSATCRSNSASSGQPLPICAATAEPAEVPTSTSESSSSRAAVGDSSAMPRRTPVSQAIPAIPPPASTSARLVVTIRALHRRVLRAWTGALRSDRRSRCVGGSGSTTRRVIRSPASTWTNSPGFQQAPARVVVHRFAGEHHRRRGCTDARTAREFGSCASRIRRRARPARARAAIQDVELVGVRVAQRPHVGGRAQQHVDRVDRRIRREPPASASTTPAVSSPSRARIEPVIKANTRSESVSPRTRSSVPTSRSRSSMTSSPSTHTVVREDPAVLQKRVGVADVERTRRRVTNMGDERRAGHLVRFGGEVGVLPRRYRLLVQLRPTVLVENTQAGAVRVLPALLGRLSGASSSQNVAVQTSVPACRPKVDTWPRPYRRSADELLGQLLEPSLRA